MTRQSDKLLPWQTPGLKALPDTGCPHVSLPNMPSVLVARTAHLSCASRSFSAVLRSFTPAASLRRRRAISVRRFRVGVPPSNTNTGRTRWNSSLQESKRVCCYAAFCNALRGRDRAAQAAAGLNHTMCIGDALIRQNSQTANGIVSHLQMRLKKPRRWAFRTRSPSWLRIALMNWTSQMDASAR